MDKIRKPAFLCAALVLLAAVSFAQAPPAAHSFAVSGKRFLRDGQPYQVISGEMHYPRVPRAYWRDRFRMARLLRPAERLLGGAPYHRQTALRPSPGPS